MIIDDYTKRVWEGDPATVAEAEQRYRQNSALGLIPLATALYSARANPENAARLVALAEPLREASVNILSLDCDRPETADRIDELSTYLEWIARRPEINRRDRSWFRFWTQRLIDHGKNIAHERQLYQTYCLLLLTEARLVLSTSKNPEYLVALLHPCRLYAYRVVDLRQRARILGKLGFLERKAGYWGEGYWHGMRAIAYFPLVPWNVTKKNIAALLGIEQWPPRFRTITCTGALFEGA